MSVVEMIFEPELWCRWSTWAIRRMKSLKRPWFCRWFLDSNPFNHRYHRTRFQQEFCMSIPNFFLWIFCLILEHKFLPEMIRVPWCHWTMAPQWLDKLMLQELYDVDADVWKLSISKWGVAGVIKKHLARKWSYISYYVCDQYRCCESPRTHYSQPTTTFHHQGLAGDRYHRRWLELGRTVPVWHSECLTMVPCEGYDETNICKLVADISFILW